MSTQTHPSNTLASLIKTLGHKDGMRRQSAREALVSMGAPAVPPLSLALQDARSEQVRWEASKALGEIGDPSAIPVLVKALEDENSDVVWLAAEALNTFGISAWPTLLQALIDEGTETMRLRESAHHVFHEQKEVGYDDLLASLMAALELGSLPSSAPMAAQDILNRMRENS